MTQPTRFETGRRYYCRSVCNYDCVWTFEIVGRTEKSVRIREVDDGPNGKIRTRRIREWYGVETCAPLGSYSMAPQLSADRLAA